MKVVISQSMLFPWVGMLEQIRLADVFVHYDDVQFSKGSFTNRVQIKTPDGSKWMTIPLKNLKLGQSINEVQVAASEEWREKNLALVKNHLKGTPFLQDALDIASDVFNKNHENLGELARESMAAVTDYFDLFKGTSIIKMEDLNVPGSGSDRVYEIVKSLGGDEYISGRGGLNYLNHQKFDEAGIMVKYMEYKLSKYPQLHGEFTPYVSSLDLIANCGKSGKEFISSEAIYYKNIKY
jgi:hypothetical protein